MQRHGGRVPVSLTPPASGGSHADTDSRRSPSTLDSPRMSLPLRANMHKAASSASSRAGMATGRSRVRRRLISLGLRMRLCPWPSKSPGGLCRTSSRLVGCGSPPASLKAKLKCHTCAHSLRRRPSHPDVVRPEQLPTPRPPLRARRISLVLAPPKRGLRAQPRSLPPSRSARWVRRASRARPRQRQVALAHQWRMEGH